MEVTTMRVRRRSFVQSFAGMAMLALAGCRQAAPPALAPVAVGTAEREPPGAAAFMAAFARGDDATAERVASPLYRAEWERRKVPLSARYTWHAAASRESLTDEWLHFTFIGGIVGPSSDQHFIYTAISDRASGDQARSVWRLDTGADGKVIWSELVYLFSEETTQLQPVVQGRDAVSKRDVADALLTPRLAAADPWAIVGVHATSSREGYYGLILPPVLPVTPTVTPTPSAQVRVLFLAIDTDGYVRPGIWTYGAR
jgi:hypothetical protein